MNLKTELWECAGFAALLAISILVFSTVTYMSW